MELKIGQRDVTVATFIVVSVLSVVLSQPPEEVLALVLEMIGPLALIGVTLLNMINVIQTRVRSGELTPGSFRELLSMREWWYAITVLLVGAVSIGGRDILGIETSSETKEVLVNLTWNGVMLAGNYLLSSLTERPATVTPPNVNAVASVPYYKEQAKY